VELEIMPKVRFSRGTEESSKMDVINPARRTGRNISPLKIAKIKTAKLNAIKPSIDLPFFSLLFPKTFPNRAEKASPIIEIAKPTKAYFPNMRTFIKMPRAITEASLRFLLSCALMDFLHRRKINLFNGSNFILKKSTRTIRKVKPKKEIISSLTENNKTAYG
jgi:hypothetical protein